MEKWREILTVLTDQQKLQVLQQQYPVRRRPLQCAAIRGHTEIISTLLTSLQSSAYRLKLLMVYDMYYRPLHEAADCGHTESVKMILDCLTPDQQIRMMSVQDCDYGNTAIHIEGETAMQCAERWGQTDTVRMLRPYQQRVEQLQQEEEQRRLRQYRKSLSGKIM